ncbi:hypothetical protein PsalN5692_01881 [Piscirickettsia salmonis]|uniref:hypothetical protein n=1 Tax=Piscirickettsia salmonis TaxID=1238 RepID=UPI0012B8C7C5|nr:hypothetical protein [Piscirickettsia salmonis]QGP50417.1 hypothetical protein PsalN5692_01881 [Piscirickettsia salmonis]
MQISNDVVWKISGPTVTVSAVPEAALASGQEYGSMRWQPRVIFTQVTMNGDALPVTVASYEGGDTASTASALVLRTLTMPCSNPLGMHTVAFSGYVSRDFEKQLTTCLNSQNMATVVFSLGGINKNQTCTSPAASDGANTWYQGFEPKSNLEIKVPCDREHIDYNQEGHHLYLSVTGGFFMPGASIDLAFCDGNEGNFVKNVTI